LTNTKTYILFTSTFITPFIKSDLQSLQKNYSVKPITETGLFALWKYLKAVNKIDITFSWFASVYSSVLVFLTKIFRKKSIVIIGGVDVAQEKEYNYGIWNSWWKSRIVRYGIIHADYVLAVDESLKKEAMRLCKYDGNNISVVHTGYDSTKWFPKGEKEQFVLSVGICPDMHRIKKKGFDVLFSVAERMINTKFVVIGIEPHIAEQLNMPPNVQCFPKINQAELLHYYQRAKVFAQLSRHEGMPNTLCEAMMCECIPVGSDVFGIPTAIKDKGFIVKLNELDAIETALRNAMNAPSEFGCRARKRILEYFPLELREKKILRIIHQLEES